MSAAKQIARCWVCGSSAFAQEEAHTPPVRKNGPPIVRAVCADGTACARRANGASALQIVRVPHEP